MFNFDFLNTIKRLLPPKRRKIKYIAWLAGLFSPLRKLKDQFTTLQADKNYEIAFNTQTLSLENRINQHYSLPLGTIYIETIASISNDVFDFWLSENQTPKYVYWLSENSTPQYIYWLSETSPQAIGNDFIVYVPAALVFDEQEMKAIINLYKLAGKRYTIVAY